MSFDFELCAEENCKTVMQLRTRFFKYHTEKNRIGKPRGIEPISLVLNPKQIIDESNPFQPNVYYVLYYKSYFVTIEQSHIHPILGPHVAKLFLQIYPPAPYRMGRQEWIGTATFQVNFHDEERIRIMLRRAIRTRQYFIGEKLEELKINMNPPEITEPIAV